MVGEKEINKIRDLILNYYDITAEDFWSNSRKKPVAEARQVFFYYLREKYKFSYSIIAKIFKKDHTTALHAYKKIKGIIKYNSELSNFIDFILNSDGNTNFHKMPTGQLKKNHKGSIYLDSYKETEEDEFLLDELLCKLPLPITLLILENSNLFQKNKNGYSPTIEPRKYNFPINFNDNYLKSIFSKLTSKDRSIFIDRYGFKNEKLKTLDEISKNNNISRERVRQIISATTKRMFKNNYEEVGQIIYYIIEKIDKYKLVSIKDLLKEIFIFDNEEGDIATRFLLAILSIENKIKKIELSKKIFLINVNDKNDIFKKIDDIRLLMKNIEANAPEIILEKNKKEYIISEIKLNKYLLDSPQFLNDHFIDACYDNYLFESDVVVYDKENFKKYKISDKKEDCGDTMGVPSE